MREFIGSSGARVEDEVPGIFRLEMGVYTERMRHQIEQHLFDHADVLREEAGKHIAWMLDNNVFQTLVRELIDKTTREVVEDAVRGAITAAFYDPKFKLQLRRGILKHLTT